MNFILNGLLKAAAFIGVHVPDVVNDDMGAEEKRGSFAAMVEKEEDIVHGGYSADIDDAVDFDDVEGNY